jgi:Brp/Blh family beta-carotene 15,15'-monooxygenase
MSYARHRTIQRTVFVFSAVSVCIAVQFASAVPGIVQVTLLAILVATVGLPHGALDPLVAYHAGFWKGVSGLFAFLLAYILLAALALLVWYFFPGMSLLVFLLYSAFHFSGDWRQESVGYARLAPGTLLVGTPPLFHPEETLHYFALLSGADAAERILLIMQACAVVALLGLVLGLILRRFEWSVILEIGLLLVASYLLQPLLFFMLYFCAMHSPRHILHAAKGLPLLPVLLTGFLFTVLTVALAVAAFPLLETVPRYESIIQIVFIGLAVLTVPHMLLVECAETRKAAVPI